MMMAVAANDLLDVWKVGQLIPKNIYGEEITYAEIRRTISNQDNSGNESEEVEMQENDNSVVFD